MRRVLAVVALLLLPSIALAQKNCKKGIPCGGTCISADKVCRVGTPPNSPPASSNSTPSRSSFAHLEPSVQAPAEGLVDSLRSRVADLERRVDALEAFLREEPWRSRAVVSADAQGITSWRRLRRGMTMDQVRTVLGEPENVTAMPSSTIWQYPSVGSVSFRADRVEGWSEPLQ